ncbi:MAG: PQQ-binding-like beta-propeller repeat protein [bacterium]
MKERLIVFLVLLAGVVLSALVITSWRRHPLDLTVGKRLPLADELAALSPPVDASGELVQIGAGFARSAGLPSSLGGAWPCFRGTNHDNIVSDGIRLADSWPAGGPPVLWSVEAGEGYAGPVIMNGRVYLLDYDGGENADTLRCLSLDDGREIWRRWYKVRIKRNHGMSRTVPAVSGQYVVTIGPRCHVMCVDSVTGDFRWGIDLEKEWGATVPMWYTGECPLIDGGQAVIAVGGRALLIGVDLETGKVLWQTPNPRKWQMSHSSVVPMELDGQKMYVYCALGGIAGVSAGDTNRGNLLWDTAEWNHQVVAPAPVPMGAGRLFVTAGYGAGSAMFSVARDAGKYSVRQIYKLDKKVFASEQQTPIFYRGYLYSVLPADAGAARKQAVCINPEDGQVMWTSGAGERFGLGPFMIADDKLLLLEDDGVLTMIRASEKGYIRLARARVLDGKEAWAPMAMAGGLLIVRDYGRMKCLDLRAGQ